MADTGGPGSRGDANPTGFWLVIGLQGAVIGLCAWAASTYRH